MLTRPPEVLHDPERIAADGMDVRGRELDQALVEVALARVGRAHPGRLEVLVSLEEPAGLVRRDSGPERRRTVGLRQRPVGLPPTALENGGRQLRRAHRYSSSTNGRRLPKPVDSSCQKPTSSSPNRQHSHTWRPLTSAGKSTSPDSMSRSVIPSSSIRATPACIWSMT